VVLDKVAGSWFIGYSSVVGYDGARNVRNEELSVGRKRLVRKAEPSSKRRIRWPSWTGFRNKTIWDFLQLLIVPLMLAAIGFWFTAQQDARQQQTENQRAQQSQKIENQRAEAERELAKQRAQDEALQAYLDQMSGLLLERDLRTSEVDSEVRTLARVRTLTVLERLGPSRKTAVMQFLVEAELVQRVGGRGPLITLTGANLRNADLQVGNLSGADLEDADLTFADVDSADLSYANLSNADLEDADLSYAVRWTEKQLMAAESLEGVIMPNGQKYEDWVLPTGKFSTKFEPAFLIEVGEDWSMLAPEAPDHVWLQRGLEGGVLLFTNPSDVFDPSNLSEAKRVPAPENAKEWISWFQRHPNLEMSKPVPVSVGGASGWRIDVTASSTLENYPRNICGPKPCVPLYQTSADPVRARPSDAEWKDRYVSVDVRGQTVVINVYAPEDKFDAFFPKAQKVLDTVEWKGENSGPS
jgi:hypothetical protein